MLWPAIEWLRKKCARGQTYLPTPAVNKQVNRLPYGHYIIQHQWQKVVWSYSFHFRMWYYSMQLIYSHKTCLMWKKLRLHLHISLPSAIVLLTSGLEISGWGQLQQRRCHGHRPTQYDLRPTQKLKYLRKCLHQMHIAK